VTDQTATLTARPPADPPLPVSMQMIELVLKTGNFERAREWYRILLDRDPFLEREPDHDAAPVDGQERAADVRLAFFRVYDATFPFAQILAIFGIDGTPDTAQPSPGMHHFQFRLDSLEALVSQYERLASHGIHPHRTANHGPGTSMYYRDPDGTIIEQSCGNCATPEEQAALVSSAAFRRDPSGREWDAAEFVARYRAGEPLDSLLSLSPES
jgi:catechol 2,3-dioxygenase-like lactoylglutathione lyase family enzyme